MNWKGCAPRCRAASSACRRSCTCAAPARGGRRGRRLRRRRSRRCSRRPERSTICAAGPRSASSASGSTRSTCSRRARDARSRACTAGGRFTARRSTSALTQAGRPLHEVLGREARPLTFVVSLRLGEPPSLDPVNGRLKNYPTLRFKLDATSSWTPELIEALVATGAVDSIDFKALYRGTIVDQLPDPVLVSARRSRRSPTRGSRTRTSSTRAPPRRSPTSTTGSPGTPRSTRSPTSSRSRSRRRMVNIKPSRIGGLPSCARPTTTAPSTASAPTAAGSSSSAPAAGRRSTSRRCFIPTRPTTSRRWAFTRTTHGPGLPASPLPPAPSAVGFRWESS